MPDLHRRELVPSEPRRNARGYVVAVLLIAAAVYGTHELSALLAPMRLFFFWIAILLSALFGIGPAVLAIALAAFAIAFFVVEPLGTLAIRTGADLLRFGLFVTFAGGIGLLGAMGRRAQKKAKALHGWFATTLGSIGDAVIAADSSNKAIFMNGAARELTGWNPRDAMGKSVDSVIEIIDEDTRERVPVAGVGDRRNLMLVARDGREVAVAGSVSPIKGSDGVPHGTVVVLREVTDERALERTRQKSREDLHAAATTYRTLAEASPTPQAIWTATADGVIEWTDRWLEITGQTREEVEASGGLAVVHPDDAARMASRWATAVRTGEMYADELRVRVPSGRYRWFSVRAVPVVEGSRVARWVGAITDIHERKRQESNTEIVNRASAILGSSLDLETTLRSLAKLCVPELADWCTVDLAREPYERLAVEHSDPRKVELAFDLDRRYRPRPDVDPIVRTLTTGVAQIAEEIPDELLVALAHDEQHLAIVRSLGLESWIMVPMTARGRILGALTLVSAESGRRYSEEDLPLLEELGRRAGMAIDNASLYREAELANRAKDDFLATLSHELRTPLTAIAGWSGMLQMGGLDEPTTRAAIDTIARSARAQAELIDDLLDLSRVVAGRLELSIEDVDLWTVAREVVAAARPAAEARKVRMSLAAAAPVVVRGDRHRLAQIIWNLVSNAVKFTETGGSIAITVSAAGETARLEVVDTGRGITAEFLPHVWERFRQADSSSSRRHGGLGLGLSLVRHLTELHGGTASVESDGLGKGSRFTIEFPLRDTVVPHLAAPVVAFSRDSLAGRRILVVDDDADSRDVISAMLRQSGAEVAIAASATEAENRALAQQPDLMVTDIAMAGEDGYSLLERMRRISARIPIVALSALGGSENRQRALRAGFDDFLEKPIEASLLVETIARQLH